MIVDKLPEGTEIRVARFGARHWSLGVTILCVVGLTMAGCAPIQNLTARAEEVSQIKLYLRNLLAAMDQVSPKPNACALGVSPSGAGYIVNLAGWTEQAGLRRGDRIRSIAGVPVAGVQDIFRALATIPAGGPLLVEVSRADQTVNVSLPCRDPTETWSMYRQALAAGANGKWEDCVRLSQRAEYLAGFTTSTSETLFLRLRCMSGKNGSLGRRDGPAEANLLYQVNLLRLRERRYVPEGLDRVRGSVLSGASWLRSNGFTSLASDLETQLQIAGQAESTSQETPHRVPERAVTRGTGFVVRPDGTILSAFHIVQGTKSITVTCPDGPRILGMVETVASTNDLVVVRISRPTPSYLSLARPRSVRVGDPVFTIGFPASTILGTEPKFTDGSVSALSGPGGEATFIQMTVPVQPGNSGGALLNDEGQVVGVVTSSAAIRPFIMATGTLPQNINWAVKSEYATPLFEPPTSQLSAMSRGDAIDRAVKATCMIEAVR